MATVAFQFTSGFQLERRQQEESECQRDTRRYVRLLPDILLAVNMVAKVGRTAKKGVTSFLCEFRCS